MKVATDSAYGAMAAYIFTFLLCVILMIKEAISPGESEEGTTRRRSGNAYSDIPQSADHRDEYEMNLNLPESVQDGVFS